MERVAGDLGHGGTGPMSDLVWGLERETHRVLRDGSLAPTSHPACLRPPGFTRDFAESQLEIVTRPARGLGAALGELDHLTAMARRALGRERLWPFSMPPRLPDDSLIRIADFGSGEEAHRARLYREGLALRYGKARQMICGVHVNVSLGASLLEALRRLAPLTAEEQGAAQRGDGYYLRLARHLRADLPLFVLLFGASPIRGEGVASGAPATSYRNSPLGYAGGEFSRYWSLESVDAYLAGIRRGLRTESEAFGRLGLVRDGRARQLSPHVFQSDKEFYAPIRLRQVQAPGESTLSAIARRGIGYLELRFPDVDPFVESGVSAATLRLLQLFILDGAFRASIPPSAGESRSILDEAAEVALWDPRSAGAVPAAGARRSQLERFGRRLESLEGWAQALDGGVAQGSFRGALSEAAAGVADPRLLPAGRLLRRIEDSGTDWTTLGARIAQSHRARPHASVTGAARRLDHGLDHAGV